MLKAILISMAVVVASANLANALSKHEADIQYIDATLPSAHLSLTKKAEVIRLRNKGADLHSAGRHGGAEVVLEKAKAILQGH